MPEDKESSEFELLSLTELRDKRDALALEYKDKVLSYLDKVLLPFLYGLKESYPKDAGRIDELILLANQHKSAVETNMFVNRPQDMFAKLILEWTKWSKPLREAAVNEELKHVLENKQTLIEENPDGKLFAQLVDISKRIRTIENK